MWPWITALVAAIVVGAAALVPMPYYIDGPGVVRATQPLVTIEGRRSYQSDGEVLFTTVSERRATPFLLLRAWLDSTMDAVPEEVANPTGNRQEETRFEQKLMDRSKLVALLAAFDHLDLPLEVTGSGALVQQVTEGFPAARAVRPGDVITSVDGTAVDTLDDVRPLLADKAVGDEVVLGLRRRGQPSTAEPEQVTVELARNEDDPSRAYLGVLLQTADEKVVTPFEVEFDSGSVIGPSAGLAWTLGVIDRLTPGDLTGGRRVAVTGTIDADGAVGPIGGLPQKVAGAQRAGATLFLYPSDTSRADVRRAREIAGDDLRLRPVATLEDALRILDPSGLGAASG